MAETVDALDGPTRYRVSRALRMRFEDDGAIRATTSFSLAGVEIVPDVVGLLACFDQPRTLREGLALVRERIGEVSDADFAETVGPLVDQWVLVPEHHEAERFLRTGWEQVGVHVHMLRDVPRVMAYRAAIFAHCRDKVVAERSFVDNGVSDRVRLFRGNSQDIELPERAEVLIHEILGSDPVRENIIPTLLDAQRRLLVPGARLIPWRIETCCRAYEDVDPTGSKSRILEACRELGPQYGLSLDGFLEAVRSWDFEQNPRGYEFFPPRLLSAECRLFDADLRAEVDRQWQPVERQLPLTQSGRVDGLVLYFRAHLDEQLQIGCSPVAAKTSWGWQKFELAEPRSLQQGEQLTVRARVDTDAAQRVALEIR